MQKEEYKEKEETERGGMVLKKVVTYEKQTLQNENKQL